MNFKDLFRVKTDVRTNKHNTITINSNTDTLYKIGEDLGEIKAFMSSFSSWKNDVETKLVNHENRIKKLESK